MCATAMTLANFKPLVFSSMHGDHYSVTTEILFEVDREALGR